MRFLQLYLIEPITKDIFDYKSRTGRKQYALFGLCLSLIWALLICTKFMVKANAGEVGAFTAFLFGFFFMLVLVASALSFAAATIRRLNDINFKPFWALLLLVPVAAEAGVIFLMIKRGKTKEKLTLPAKIHIFTFVTVALAVMLVCWNCALLFKSVKRAQTPWYQNAAIIKAVEQASPSALSKVLTPFTKLDLPDADGNTALIYTIRKHPVEEVILPLINLKANVNAARPNGDTPLYIAIAKSADIKAIELLINKGALVNIENKQNITPLMVAVKKGNEKTVALLLMHGAAVVNSIKQNALEWGNPVNPTTRELLKLALNPDFNADYKNNIYKDVLADRDISDRLTAIPRPDAPPQPDKEEEDFETQKQNALRLIGSLPEAFKNADKSWAKKMVSKGLTMGKISDGGQTPLMYAAMFSGDSDVLDVFIEAGADVNAKDKDGVTALAWAASVNPEAEITEFLADKGANVNAVSKKDISVLGYAAIQTQNPQIIDILVEHGADVNFQGAGGGTPLIYAALHNSNEDIIETLIKNGADVKSRDAGGTPVINYAAKNKNRKILSVIRQYVLDYEEQP